MPIFILIYLSIIGILCYLAKIYMQLWYQSVYIKYIAISILSFLFWLCLYLLSFTTTINPELILIYSRFLYILTFIGACSMSLAFYFYGDKDKDVKKFNKQENLIIVILFGILLVSVFSDFFVKDVVFNDEEGVYIESFGLLFFIVQILYILNPTVSLLISRIKYKRLKGIMKKRFIYLSIGYHIFIFLLLIFLGILPTFDIWILQKEQVLFFIPFIFSLWYPLYRYRFGNITTGVCRILIFLSSAALTLIILAWSKYYLSNLGGILIEFWGLSSSRGHVEYAIGLILFYLIHKFLWHKFLTSNENNQLQIQINKIKVSIPSIQNINKLNTFLAAEFLNKLKISGAEIIEIGDKDQYPELTSFFDASGKNNFIFLNDYIFIEESKHKFSKATILLELDQNISMYLPLYKEDKVLIGFLGVGFKYMKEYFSSDEIEVLIDFSHFITGHLKYIQISQQIHELNLTLDKKVDEKTIEFNNLISRQKEFIAYLGHEVRNPITNIIFLCSDIQMGVQDLEKSKETKILLEDVSILNEELVKIADLTKNIFSTEKMDLGKIKLYKKKIVLYDFLYNEIKTLQKAFPNIHFQTELENIGEYEIDEVQFREVIHNLLTNSLKYVSKDEGKILLSLIKKDENIFIKIEDNGKGLSSLDIKNIFEKYATGNNDSIGLGMGLYLCKRIVELHGGTIYAEDSQKLGGASFTIKL